MSETALTLDRCIHCLIEVESSERDHVFPNSWYPDSTPQTVQRPKAPSCPKCNRAFGHLERDLFVRIVPCIDPKSESVAGLMPRVMRSFGFDTAGLPEKEQQYREAFLKKYRAELMKPEELGGKPGRIPGLGPPDGVESPASVPIPWAAFRIVGEKIARGCEFNLKGRYVEPPYAVSVSIEEQDVTFTDDVLPFVKNIDLGPGCQIRRIFAMEDPGFVRYWITIWGALRLFVAIDNVGYVENLEAKQPRNKEGLDLSDRPAMRINPYLSEYKN
jgi:hypothetical protein